MKNHSQLKIVPPQSLAASDSALQADGLNVWINDTHILDNLSVKIPKNRITCIIGPSGSGKSTLVRSFNRINDNVDGFCFEGQIMFNGKDIYDEQTDPALLRSKVGMVFQKPCVFPKSISENVLFGIKRQKKLTSIEKLQIVEENLKAVSLWKEVSHRLKNSAFSLSIGQQQRLCVARCLAVKPEVILMDEPTSSLDPVSARAVEQTILKLKQNYTIVFVTHNIQQAERIADQLIFLCDGKVIEQGSVNKLFQNPEKHQTKEYLKNEFCDC
ncbi:MAG: phosphate ABC transporter ATP-binding protein [Balneola sp.]